MFIYKTINKINGKIYIGLHTKKSRSYLGSGKIIKKAIKKYGKENFIREIIEDNIEDINILVKREIYWINFYDATNPKIGYNLTLGGEGAYGFPHSEEVKEKMSKNHADFNGEKNPFFGKKHSEESNRIRSKKLIGHSSSKETREKLSIANKGKKASEETKKKLSIAMLNRIISPESIEKASQSRRGRKQINKKTSSKYTGVWWDKRSKKWKAAISKDNIKYNLGSFNLEKEAAIIWNNKAIELGVSLDKLNVVSGDILSIKEKYKNINSFTGIRKSVSKKSSKYIGVLWNKKFEKWEAKISKNRIVYYLGLYNIEEEAAYAWNKKAIELGVPNDRLNIIDNEKEIEKMYDFDINKFKGVYPNKNGKRWFSIIIRNKKRYYLGTYDTKYEAFEAYNKKDKDLDNF